MLPGSSPPCLRTSAIRGSTPGCQGSFLHGLSVCRKRSCPFGPQGMGRLGKDLSLISFGIVVGPSRLIEPIGWPRKAGSTSFVPCSPFSSLALTLYCALAAGIHAQASHFPHLVEPSRPASGEESREAVLTRPGDDGTQSRREFSSRTPPGAATDSYGGPDSNWLVGSMACKQCTLAAEHAAGNRCTNRIRTEQINYAAMQGTAPLCRRLQLFSAQPSERHTLHNPQHFACFGLLGTV